MEYLFNIFQHHSCIVSPNEKSSVIDNKIEINSRENSLKINQKKFNYHQIIHPNNNERISELIIKTLKEQGDINLIFIEEKNKTEINEVIKKLINIGVFNIKEKFFSLIEFNSIIDSVYDLNSKEQLRKEPKFTTDIPEIKNVKNCWILTSKISYTNSGNVSQISFVNINKDYDKILPFFSYNNINQNLLIHLIAKINLLIEYQANLANKLALLPSISAETLNDISSYKNECLEYYSKIIEDIDTFKKDICKKENENTRINGQNISEKIDHFLDYQNNFLQNKISKQTAESESKAYKNLLNYYTLKESHEIDKEGAFESLKDLIYRFIDSNEEILSFMKTKTENCMLKEKNAGFNGLEKIEEQSKREGNNSIFKELNFDDIFEAIDTVNEKSEELSSQYYQILKEFLKFRKKILDEKEKRINLKSIKNYCLTSLKDKSPLPTLPSTTVKTAELEELKKQLKEKEKIIQKLKAEIKEYESKVEKQEKEIKILTIKNNEYLQSKRQKEKSASMELGNNIAKRNNYKIKVNSKIGLTKTDYVNPGSLVLLNKIAQENKEILNQLKYFKEKGTELQAELSSIQKSNASRDEVYSSRHLNCTSLNAFSSSSKKPSKNQTKNSMKKMRTDNKVNRKSSVGPSYSARNIFSCPGSGSSSKPKNRISVK